jgi:GT2 family glycosyltransferase
MRYEKRPSVGIIIVNWNKKEMTGNCLETLKMTKYPNFQVILVDNGSTDDSINYLKKIWPNLHVISLDKNYGYTTGTNIGWKYAIKVLKTDYICAMDNDIVTVQPEWLDLIINELEKSQERGIGSGKHLFPDGRLQTPYEGADKTYQMDKGNYDHIKEVNAFVGPAIVIKKQVIQKIGYYDENFFYGPNDIDYCYRARKAGFKIVYNGLSKSVHIGSASGRSPMKDLIYRHQSEGMMLFSFRYGPKPGTRA